MHGLVNKAFQSFLTDTFGVPVWQAVLGRAGQWDQIGPEGFDPLLVYDDHITFDIVAAAAAELGRTADSVLEDLGTYLVSHERTERLRRLLRFGGVSYTDFLRSLDDLQGRARLAVPGLDLPNLTLRAAGEGLFQLTCHACPPGFGHVMAGVLRALADDYGALVVLEHRGRSADGTPPGAGDECLAIEVHDPAFHAGRRFDLAALVGGGE